MAASAASGLPKSPHKLTKGHDLENSHDGNRIQVYVYGCEHETILFIFRVNIKIPAINYVSGILYLK